jgi:hypothetical protein
MMELAVVIATVLPRVRLEPTERIPVPVRGSILRAAGGVHLRVDPA